MVEEFDFAIVADDIMLNGAFLLRQSLAEFYECALWFPKDLEGYADQLEGIPRVFFIGESSYSRFFGAMTGTAWEGFGVKWGAKGRSCVIRATSQLEDDPDRQRTVDMELARVRRQITLEKAKHPKSPGHRVCANFLDPYTAMRTMPPTIMSPSDHVAMVQYQVAIAEFLRLGFDDWCWADDA